MKSPPAKHPFYLRHRPRHAFQIRPPHGVVPHPNHQGVALAVPLHRRTAPVGVLQHDPPARPLTLHRAESHEQTGRAQHEGGGSPAQGSGGARHGLTPWNSSQLSRRASNMAPGVSHPPGKAGTGSIIKVAAGFSRAGRPGPGKQPRLVGYSDRPYGSATQPANRGACLVVLHRECKRPARLQYANIIRMHLLTYSKQARKTLARVPAHVSSRILARMKKIASNPFAPDNNADHGCEVDPPLWTRTCLVAWLSDRDRTPIRLSDANRHPPIPRQCRVHRGLLFFSSEWEQKTPSKKLRLRLHAHRADVP